MEVAVMGPKQLVPTMSWKFWGFVFSSNSDTWWWIDIIAAVTEGHETAQNTSVFQSCGAPAAIIVCMRRIWRRRGGCDMWSRKDRDRRAIACPCGPRFNIMRTVNVCDELSNCNHTNPIRVTQTPLDRVEWKFYSWSNFGMFGILTLNICSDYEFCVLLQ